MSCVGIMEPLADPALRLGAGSDAGAATEPHSSGVAALCAQQVLLRSGSSAWLKLQFCKVIHTAVNPGSTNSVSAYQRTADMLQLLLSSMTVCRPAVVAAACRPYVQTASTLHESDMARHESPYTMTSTPGLAAASKSTTLARAVPVMKASLFQSL